jgi:hypothetical protein
MNEAAIIEGLHKCIGSLLETVARAALACRVLMWCVSVLAFSNIVLAASVVAMLWR